MKCRIRVLSVSRLITSSINRLIDLLNPRTMTFRMIWITSISMKMVLTRNSKCKADMKVLSAMYRIEYFRPVILMETMFKMKWSQSSMIRWWKILLGTMRTTLVMRIARKCLICNLSISWSLITMISIPKIKGLIRQSRINTWMNSMISTRN